MLLGAYRPGSVEDFDRVRYARLVRRAQSRVSSAVYQSPRLAVPELADDPIDLLFREHRLLARPARVVFQPAVEEPASHVIQLTGRARPRRRRSFVAGLGTALTVKGAMVLVAAAAALATGGALVASQAPAPRSEPAPLSTPHALLRTGAAGGPVTDTRVAATRANPAAAAAGEAPGTASGETQESAPAAVAAPAGAAGSAVNGGQHLADAGGGASAGRGVSSGQGDKLAQGDKSGQGDRSGSGGSPDQGSHAGQKPTPGASPPTAVAPPSPGRPGAQPPTPSPGSTGDQHQATGSEGAPAPVTPPTKSAVSTPPLPFGHPGPVPSSGQD